MPGAVEEGVDQADLLAALQRRIGEVLAPLVPPGSEVALLDFPCFSNVGDSAIWLGEIAWLRSTGVRVRYLAGQEAAVEGLSERLAGLTLLISGGGNFGDLWDHHQRFRERVVRAFPRQRIVQLPQSIRFTRPENLARARGVLGAHPDFNLLVRDEESLAQARADFPGARPVLCPDMAFFLGPLPRARPEQDVLRLGRKDIEAAVVHDEFACDRDPDPRGFVFTPQAKLAHLIGAWSALEPWLRRALASTYGTVARSRLSRGCRLLAKGRVVVTDRLHAHILCILMGVPHCLLAERFGKLRAFYGTWTRGSPLVSWCETEEQVKDVTRRLLSEGSRASVAP